MVVIHQYVHLYCSLLYSSTHFLSVLIRFIRREKFVRAKNVPFFLRQFGFFFYILSGRKNVVGNWRKEEKCRKCEERRRKHCVVRKRNKMQFDGRWKRRDLCMRATRIGKKKKETNKQKAFLKKKRSEIEENEMKRKYNFVNESNVGFRFSVFSSFLLFPSAIFISNGSEPTRYRRKNEWFFFVTFLHFFFELRKSVWFRASRVISKKKCFTFSFHSSFDYLLIWNFSPKSRSMCRRFYSFFSSTFNMSYLYFRSLFLLRFSMGTIWAQKHENEKVENVGNSFTQIGAPCYSYFT